MSGIGSFSHADAIIEIIVGSIAITLATKQSSVQYRHRRNQTGKHTKNVVFHEPTKLIHGAKLGSEDLSRSTMLIRHDGEMLLKKMKRSISDTAVSQNSQMGERPCREEDAVCLKFVQEEFVYCACGGWYGCGIRACWGGLPRCHYPGNALWCVRGCIFGCPSFASFLSAPYVPIAATPHNCSSSAMSQQSQQQHTIGRRVISVAATLVSTSRTTKCSWWAARTGGERVV